MATIFVPKDRNTFYISFFLNGKRITKNIKIPSNKRRDAEKFKKEFEAKLLLNENNLIARGKSSSLNLQEEVKKYIGISKINWSKGRVSNVSTTLNKFVGIVCGDGNVKDINPLGISTYIAKRKTDVSITTLRSDLQILRTFFNYLVEEGAILKSPISKKHIPRSEVKSVVTFEDADLQRIFEVTKINDPGFYRFLYILNSTGARRCDILNLRVGCINLNDNTLLIKISKTSREILFPIYESLQLFLSSNFPDLLTKNKDDLIFQEFKRHTVSRKFKKLKKELSLNNKYNLKTFRKTFATRLADNRIDGIEVAYLLGHTSVNTTKKYYLNQTANKIRSNLNQIKST